MEKQTMAERLPSTEEAKVLLSFFARFESLSACKEQIWKSKPFVMWLKSTYSYHDIIIPWSIHAYHNYIYYIGSHMSLKILSLEKINKSKSVYMS